MSPEVDRALDVMERFWESSRHAFEELAESMGCQAACLVADHRVEGDVLYRWKVTEEEASRLVRLGKGVDWCRFSREGAPISLHLFLQGGKPNQGHIELCLSNWASSLSVAAGGPRPSNA